MGFSMFFFFASTLWISWNVWNTDLGTWALNSSAKHRSHETHQDWPREPQPDWAVTSCQVLEGIKVLWQGSKRSDQIANSVWIISSFPNPFIQNEKHPSLWQSLCLELLLLVVQTPSDATEISDGEKAISRTFPIRFRHVFTPFCVMVQWQQTLYVPFAALPFHLSLH